LGLFFAVFAPLREPCFSRKPSRKAKTAKDGGGHLACAVVERLWPDSAGERSVWRSMRKKTKYEKPAVVPLGDAGGGAACADGAFDATCPSGGAVSGAPCKVGSTTANCFMGDAASRGCASGTTKL